MTTYAFYPGCSLESSSAAYDRSTKAVVARLGIELCELDDWNCCGATEYCAIDRVAGHALIARNLARVDPGLQQLVAPCSACYLNLRKTDKLMMEHPEFEEKINDALNAGELHYDPGSVQVRHLLDVLYEDVGEERVRAAVVRPLSGLSVAPYYGCQLVRPLDDFDNAEYPVKLDEFLTWLGATVVDYPVKSHCCGGHMPQISEEAAFELLRRLLASADHYQADVLACLCPMCQLNLDAYQGRVNNYFNTSYELPVLFFTQLLGLAFGIEGRELGLGKEIVPAKRVLAEKLGGEAAPDEVQP